jgi:hypothetical protein
MQDVKCEVEDNSIKKRVTQEKSPGRVVTYTHGMSANELEKMRNYKSGKRQHVGSPVTKRAVRLHFVSDIKTFVKCASEYDAQNDSYGNPQEKVLVVSQPEREANPRTGNENLCPSHFAHATQLSSDARESKIAATTKWVGCFGGVLARCTQGLLLLAAHR